MKAKLWPVEGFIQLASIGRLSSKQSLCNLRTSYNPECSFGKMQMD